MTQPIQGTHPKLVEARLATQHRFPSFSAHLYRHNSLVHNPEVPTARTNGKKIEFGDWALAQPLPERVFMLAHECLHDVFQHIPRAKAYRAMGFGPDGLPFDSQRMNAAADYYVNDLLTKAKVGRMPAGGLLDSRFTTAMTVDEIYEQLPPNPPENGFDEHDMDGDPEAGDEGESDAPAGGPPPTLEEVESKVRENLTAMKAAGALPGDLARIAGQLLEPKISWKDQLKDMVQQTIGRDALTWRRPNRKRLVMAPHPYLPGRDGFATDCVVVAPDVSGSISSREYDAFVTEVVQIIEDASPREVWFMPWDTATAPKQLEAGEEPQYIPVYGGGGTNYACVPQAIRELGINPNVVICLTDGYVMWPPESEIEWPHITVSTSSEVAPFGDNIRLELD